MRIDTNGKVGIGTNGPNVILDVSGGAIVDRTYDDGAGTAIDWSKANVQTTSASCGGGPQGGTIGLLPTDASDSSSVMTPRQRAGIHIELTTDHLDELYEELKARGVEFFEPPHEEPWERSMRTHDPDGYTVEFAEGRRGHRGVT
jgi:catechol 2,3-dioxygenase-like lactoylglutathione lyase family enzyme